MGAHLAGSPGGGRKGTWTGTWTLGWGSATGSISASKNPGLGREGLSMSSVSRVGAGGSKQQREQELKISDRTVVNPSRE